MNENGLVRHESFLKNTAEGGALLCHRRCLLYMYMSRARLGGAWALSVWGCRTRVL